MHCRTETRLDRDMFIVTDIYCNTCMSVSQISFVLLFFWRKCLDTLRYIHSAICQGHLDQLEYCLTAHAHSEHTAVNLCVCLSIPAISVPPVEIK